ncbi:MAG: 30S ribosomal protein S5 alanine N-acetyltransferase [Micavibrio aeruginosavorus]|uniref:30S ribosomal protein S5 alanine N-acetyltransferase n=1 Tax=Micavibrio aeruginosavorus TaxID=349221 RepID=A0A2W5MZ62_9BACT|nr:MAG: 30S ribosomal protein S5 alanine N-acetyltransferase [Micavibrio aeruginosavorus]
MWPSAKKMRPVVIAPVLTTERLSLRPGRESDYDQWKIVRSLNQNYLKPFEPAWPSQSLSPDFFRRRVARLSKEWTDDKTYAFLIFKDGYLIGGINLNGVMRGAAQSATFGYWLDELSQGNGYMAEAAGAVLKYAFTTLKLERVNAATLVHNGRSRNMLLRLGFEEEGFARSYLQIEGRRQDHVLYGLNKDAWILRAAAHA